MQPGLASKTGPRDSGLSQRMLEGRSYRTKATKPVEQTRAARPSACGASRKRAATFQLADRTSATPRFRNPPLGNTGREPANVDRILRGKEPADLPVRRRPIMKR